MILRLKNGLWLQIQQKLTIWRFFNKEFKRKNVAWNFQIFNIFVMILRLRPKIFNYLIFSYDFKTQAENFQFFNIFLMILRLRLQFTQEDARPDSLIQTSQKGLRLQIQQILTIWLDFNKDFIWKNEAWNLQILWFTEGPYFWGSLLFSDAWFWRYLSWPEVL